MVRLLPLALATLALLQGPAPRPLDRVVVLGASVSRGFNLGLELKADVAFGDVLACALASEDARCTTHASGGFYLDPIRVGRRLVDETLGDEPTLVVAIDFLFWYGYGSVASEEDRLRRLELGLAQLERLSAPLVVADFPDLTEALSGDTPIGALMQPEYLPRPETRAALSARVRRWAAARGDVLVLSLASFVERAFAGETITVRGRPVAGSGRELFQSDLLHPTVGGSIVLALSVADLLVRSRDDVAADGFLWDPDRVRARLEERTAAERERALERERRRAERKRKLEERRKRRKEGSSGDGGAGEGSGDEGPPRSREEGRNLAGLFCVQGG